MPSSCAAIMYGNEEISCDLTIRVYQPFDGYFELKLTDGTGVYSSIMTLEDLDNMRSVQRSP